MTMRTARAMRRKAGSASASSGLLQHQADAAREAGPRRFFLGEPFLAGLRQPIESRATVVLRGAPIGGDPALFLQTLQRRIERALLHLEDVIGELADPLRDRPAVHRLEG